MTSEIRQLALDMTAEAKESGEDELHELNVGSFLAGAQRPKLEGERFTTRRWCSTSFAPSAGSTGCRSPYR